MPAFLNRSLLNKGIILKLIVFVVISILCLHRTTHLLSYPTGDGGEYVLVTEAFYKHKSPDIRAKDSWSFKKSFTKILPWDSVYKPYVFDGFEDFVEKPNKKFMETFGGLYVANNGKVYGYHFFTYSLFNVPARYFCGLLNKNPLSAFKITNAVLILITCFLLLFYTPFNHFTTSLIAISFYFSSCYWYMGWVHTELFTVCLVTMSLWLFFQNKYYLALFIMSVAASQNQPLMLVLLFLALVSLHKRGLSLKTILKTGFSSLIGILPPLFYYYNFNTFNIIKDVGFLDAKYQTFNRIFGFYFDINQGVILAIPLVLLVYIYIWLRTSFLLARSKQKPSYHLFFLLIIIAISYTVASMGNWNHGQAVINRYATWISAIFLIHIFFFMDDLKISTKNVFISLIAASQVATTLYHEKITKWEVSWEHKPIADWILSNHPEWYNPDPTIFAGRTAQEFALIPDISPVVFINKNNEVCKIMCHKDKLNELVQLSISKKDIEKFKGSKKDLVGWIYINKGEFTTALSGQALFASVNYLRAKKNVVPRIKANPAWYKWVVESARSQNITEDSSLTVNALYALQLVRNAEEKK